MEGTATMLTVDPSNADQAREWDGEGGAFWAAHARRFDEAVAAHHRPFLDAAAIEATDRVLDIGCGSGQTTRDAARSAPGGWAFGVDLSSQLIELARSLAQAEGLANASFEQADAQVHPFQPASFDVAISRTGAIFGDAVAAFTNIARALRPGGRLALLTWRTVAENEWIREFFTALAAGRDLPTPPPDAPTPFSLAEPERVRGVLGTAGFAGVDLAPLDLPIYFGPDAADAFDFVLRVTGWVLEGLDAEGRMRALDALRASIGGHVTDRGVVYGSAAWIITARRP